MAGRGSSGCSRRLARQPGPRTSRAGSATFPRVPSSLTHSRTGRRGRAEALLDVVLDDALEVARNALAAQGQRLLAVDEDRGGRRLAGARQADADVRVLALARPVDDAAH